MDTTVEEIGAVVLRELRTAGYQESTIGQYEKTIRALSRYVEARGGVYTADVGAGFAKLTTSPRTGQFSAQRRFDYGRMVGLFEGYTATGEVDLATRKRGGGGRWPVSQEFTVLVANWEGDMVERGLAPATQDAYGRVARGFLVFLEARGVQALGGADGASVLAFLESLTDRWAKSSLFWVVANFRPFLKFTGRGDLEQAVALAGVRRSHRILPVLSDEDQEQVVHTCTSPAVSARNGAVTLLALTTGLRACDVIALRLADIDWRSGTLGIVQQKTKNPLTVPLSPLVLARLADYVLGERPASSDGHVFLRSVAPYTGLGNHASIYRIIAETFRTAGVTDVKAGTAFLRHNAASRLLAAHTPLPTIAAVLGHASAESTNTYLNLDEHRLLECVLPVPGSIPS